MQAGRERLFTGFLRKTLVETTAFFSRLEDENKSDYVASYNYSIRIKDDFYVKVNNQVIMLGSGPDEEILLCMLFPYIDKQGDDLVIENVKDYRKSVIEKLGVKSISEAIPVIMAHRML